jgi:hypothetical protein
MYGASKAQVKQMSTSIHQQSSQSGQAPQMVGGLVAGTRVMTMDGELPVEYLIPGDRILTRTGARKLATVSVRVELDAPMVRIGAGTLGYDRPCEETVVPQHQLILIRDWRAQALYGAPQALVAAGRLADGNLIKVETVAEARVFVLGFDHDVVIYAGGLEMACMREKVTA